MTGFIEYAAVNHLKCAIIISIDPAMLSANNLKSNTSDGDSIVNLLLY